MRVLENLNWQTAGRLMGWIRRPRQAVLGLRELLHARKAGPVRSNIDLSNLPEVQLVLAKNSPDLASVILLYKRNPSRFIIAPRSREALEKMLSDNVIFYRILDSRGNHVGNLAYQSARRMFSYLQIDFPYRSQGYGLAAELAGERTLAVQGVQSVYSQVFRNNHRALSTFFSLGWEIDPHQSTNEYLTLKKALQKPVAD
jgi:hypothetical protein